MKAAVLHQYGEAPKYGELPDPIPQNDNHLVMTMKAAAVKNLDKGRASGAHYSSGGQLHKPEGVGIDGVGVLADGTRVYSFGMGGMIAEMGLADKNKMVRLPDGIDYVTAAALPNAVMGAAGALHFRAGIKQGETVLINGATGVTGKVAVQIAKHYGAKKVIVTGRNADSLNKLKELGADEIISLKQEDEQILTTLKEIHKSTPVDIVIDYLWGHPAELILTALQGKGGATHPVRFVTVGGMAGDKIELSSGILRSSDIMLCGSGLGSLSNQAMGELFRNILPEMLQLAADGKLKIDTVTADLKDIEETWHKDVAAGHRLVITM